MTQQHAAVLGPPPGPLEGEHGRSAVAGHVSVTSDPKAWGRIHVDRGLAGLQLRPGTTRLHKPPRDPGWGASPPSAVPAPVAALNDVAGQGALCDAQQARVVRQRHLLAQGTAMGDAEIHLEPALQCRGPRHGPGAPAKP